jgi:hypothetical protein
MVCKGTFPQAPNNQHYHIEFINFICMLKKQAAAKKGYWRGV